MSKLFTILFSGIAVLFLGTACVAAQDDETQGQLNDELSEVAALDEGAEEAAPDFTIPEDAGPAELLAFVQGLEQRLPQPKTEEEMGEMIHKISSIYKEISDRVLADSTATDDQKRQAIELKVVAFTVEKNMGDEEAESKLEEMIQEMLTNAKTDQEKIQAYQTKLQSIAAGAQTDPDALDKVAALADEILANKDSDELQVFGLEVKAQEAFTRGRTEEGKIDEFIGFLDSYIADTAVSQRAREKAQELKLASLMMRSQSDESKAADIDTYFDEIIAGPLSPETRKAVYQMRVQSLMAGQPGQQEAPAPKPEDLEKLDSIADKLIAEESEDLQAMGYAVKSSNLMQKAQEDPANIDAVFEFADKNLADNPSDTLKTQMIGLKIQGYMLKVQQDPANAKEMLAFIDDQLASADTSEELKPRLVTVKLQVLMMQLQNDIAYADELEKTLNEMKDTEGLDRLLQSGWGALYMGKIRNIAETKGSIDDFNKVLDEVKAKMNDMPILGFLIGNIKPNLDTIGKNNGDDQFTKRVFQELIDVANQSENPLAKQVAANLQSTLDIADLQGKPLVVEGIQIGEGNKFSSSDLNGKYFMIDVWSAKDQGYFEVLEDLTSLYKDFNSKGFEIVGINTDENTDALARAIDVLGMTWPVLSAELSRGAELEAVPEALAALPPGTKVLVGPEGNVEIIDDLDSIRAFLTEKLGEPEKAEAAEETEAEAENK